MKPILLQLYDGNISPLERFSPHSKEYMEKRRTQANHYETFIAKLEKLDPALSREYFKIMDEQIDLHPIEASEMFIDGFCLGARMMIEIFDNDFADMK